MKPTDFLVFIPIILIILFIIFVFYMLIFTNPALDNACKELGYEDYHWENSICMNKDGGYINVRRVHVSIFPVKYKMIELKKE